MDNIIKLNMNTIKFTSKTTLKLNGISYKGYNVGELPNSFGFLYNEDTISDGCSAGLDGYGLGHRSNLCALTSVS